MRNIFDMGWVADPNTEEKREVILNPKNAKTITDLAIGCGVIALGIGWIFVKTFAHGGVAHIRAENKALYDLGLTNGDGLDADRQEFKNIRQGIFK